MPRCPSRLFGFVAAVLFTAALSASALADTAPAACVGDCSGTSTVAVNDLITLVNIALGDGQPSTCASGIPAGTNVDVSLIIQGVDNALLGCPIQYRLIAGSQIIDSSQPGPVVVEALQGTFEVRPLFAGPNTVFQFDIVKLTLEGGSRFAVTGDSGLIVASTFDLEPGVPPDAYMWATLLINGSGVGANGEGPYHCNQLPCFDYITDPPSFDGLEVCGAVGKVATCDQIHTGTAGGYTLTIFAVPITGK